MHSAEGYASVLLDPASTYGYNGKSSWHLSNLMDGRVFQHYPFTARCHHATAANQSYVGVENEGYAPKEKSLNEIQVSNAVRFIKEISEWKGWIPKRPVSPTDISYTLWEHNEVIRIGGTSTACPSGRIPWQDILYQLDSPEEDDEMKSHHAWATWFSGRQLAGSAQVYVAQARSDFSLPADAKAVLFQVILDSGEVEWLHGDTEMPVANLGPGTFIGNLAADGTLNFRTRQGVHFRELKCVGYYR